ncbi:MAG: RHO alpha subunit C-terminal catalytic domain-containing protein, partial [Aestuariivirgaceae bacterium]
HHHMRDKPKGGWSCERYASLLPEQTHLPQEQRRSWRYYFAYPSFAFDVYPDRMDFFHIIPLAPGRSRLRFGSYGLPGASRELNACRYLSERINMQVHKEDCALVASVQKGLESSAYHRGLLGTKEIAVAALHRWVNADMPEAGPAS